MPHSDAAAVSALLPSDVILSVDINPEPPAWEMSCIRVRASESTVPARGRTGDIGYVSVVLLTEDFWPFGPASTRRNSIPEYNKITVERIVRC